MTTTIIDHLPSRILQIDGIEHLFFSGTSYLGMGHQAEFKAALLRGMSQYGTVFSASRNNNLQLKIYEEAESFIAQWTGAEAALTTTSGLAAGHLAVQSLSNQSFIFAPSTHPAIWLPQSPPQLVPMNRQYAFENFTQFSQNIVSILQNIQQPTVVAANAIDPLRGEPFDFSWVKYLPKDQPITLLLDDSHGIGITGTSRNASGFCEDGGGIFSKIKKDIGENSQVRLIVIASLAKAVGIPGGVILSDAQTIAAIRQMPLFVGASPIVPAYLYAFLEAQSAYKSARKSLQNNIQQFQKGISTMGLSIRYLPDYPVFFVENNDLFAHLLNHKILISSFSYPKPTDPPITRIVLSALHTEGDIEQLLKVMGNG